jgi:peptide/nickel transport system substrate-binding protein
MKKTLFVLVGFVLLFSLLLGACGKTTPAATTPAATAPAATTPAATTPKATATTAPATAPAVTTTTATKEGNYGGTLKVIYTGSPVNIGYSAKQSFADANVGTQWSERILELKTDGGFYPSLAESYTTSPDLKTVTLNLRKGVKFHDGTPWNAAAAVWNFKQCLTTGALGGSKYIVSIDATDDYTVVVKLNTAFNQIIYNLARIYMYSPTAYQKNGEDWAINHCVSTSAFRVTSFQRDVAVKMEKFTDYWRPGRPYLDFIEFSTVKEPATCSAIMQSGQVDAWMTSTAQETADLKAKGFKIAETPTTYNVIYPDSIDPTSPFANKKVREAVEYAIDRPAMAKALGFGFMLALDQPTHPGTAGYNPKYPVRAYNVAKAKQLMADAGYAKGIQTKMIVQSTQVNMGTIIKNYLAEIGITVELDVADTGRFWGAINGGWKGLLLGPLAVNPQFCVAWLDHVGPMPLNKFAGMGKTPEYLAICAKVIEAPDVATMQKLTMDMVTKAGEDAMFIPLTLNLGTSVFNPKFHTGYYTGVDWTYWQNYNDYWEK